MDNAHLKNFNKILRDFYGNARNAQGEECNISSYIILCAGINHYLNENILREFVNIHTHLDFVTLNNVFVEVCRQYIKKHKKTLLHITDLEKVKKSETALNLFLFLLLAHQFC